MKKLGWILVTVAACVAWAFVVAFIWTVATFFSSLVRGGESYHRNDGTILTVIMLAGFAVLIIFSRKLYKSYNLRCPNCKKWGAMQLSNTKITKKEDVYVPIETQSRNLRGEVYGTQEQYVPGQRTTYRDFYKCKYCGNITSATRTQKRANI